MDVVVIETPQLGDRTYLVHDGSVALVIDPQRDTDRVEEAARTAGVRITHVAETHLHNDYVTGGLVLAGKLGAEYLVNAADNVSFNRSPVSDGHVLQVGRLTVRVVATPGHTHTHLAYVVRDDTHDGGMEAVFSIAQKIGVLHQGRLIAVGTPDEVRNDSEVKRVYLGERH